MATRPLIAALLTRHNRSSIAAVLAVIEHELGDAVELGVFRRPAEAAGAQLVLASFCSADARAAARDLHRLKRLRPAVLAVAGGPHATANPRGTLALGYHWVAPGEAGAQLAALVRETIAGRPPPAGVIRPSPRQPLDSYGPWPRSLSLCCPIEITRGCRLGCAFCQTPRLHGGRPRHRSLDQIGRLFAESAATGHTFTRFIAPNAFGYGSADGVTPAPRAVEQLLRLARDRGMREVFLGTFPSEVRPESATETMLALVRDLCDNDSIVVGVQSGSDRMLRALGRGHSAADGAAAVARIARAGFRPAVDLIFGLPGESESEQAATGALAEHFVGEYGARINVHRFVALPGTTLAGAEGAPIYPASRELVSRLAGRGLARVDLPRFVAEA